MQHLFTKTEQAKAYLALRDIYTVPNEPTAPADIFRSAYAELVAYSHPAEVGMMLHIAHQISEYILDRMDEVGARGDWTISHGALRAAGLGDSVICIVMPLLGCTRRYGFWENAPALHGVASYEFDGTLPDFHEN